MAMTFSFSSKRFDVDGPVKRTMDAVEKALKEMGFDWNDRRVVAVRADKDVSNPPGIDLYMYEAY